MGWRRFRSFLSNEDYLFVELVISLSPVSYLFPRLILMRKCCKSYFEEIILASLNELETLSCQTRAIRSTEHKLNINPPFFQTKIIYSSNYLLRHTSLISHSQDLDAVRNVEAVYTRNRMRT